MSQEILKKIDTLEKMLKELKIEVDTLKEEQGRDSQLMIRIIRK